MESRATRASLTTLLSPQMGKDIVWFLRRWAKTYLLVDEKLYQQVGAGGRKCVGFVVANNVTRVILCVSNKPSKNTSPAA